MCFYSEDLPKSNINNLVFPLVFEELFSVKHHGTGGKRRVKFFFNSFASSSTSKSSNSFYCVFFLIIQGLVI
ncbi:hypothetical protein RDI58_027112 [Solanum bulbocastanum]|uniref:Uncharacterized protein n=1 Tax=Solanum bulbocastanum TaxID=147425 RepID=A0AAN8Y1V5_SOLBU